MKAFLPAHPALVRHRSDSAVPLWGAVATETLRWHWEAMKDEALPVLDMGALAAPEERQDAYALLMAAAAQLWGPTGGWQPGPPAPPRDTEDSLEGCSTSPLLMAAQCRRRVACGPSGK